MEEEKQVIRTAKFKWVIIVVSLSIVIIIFTIYKVNQPKSNASVKVASEHEEKSEEKTKDIKLNTEETPKPESTQSPTTKETPKAQGIVAKTTPSANESIKEPSANDNQIAPLPVDPNRASLPEPKPKPKPKEGPSGDQTPPLQNLTPGYKPIIPTLPPKVELPEPPSQPSMPEPEPEPKPYEEIALTVPESLIDQINDYAVRNEDANVLYYAMQLNDEEKKNETTIDHVRQAVEHVKPAIIDSKNDPKESLLYAVLINMQTIQDGTIQDVQTELRNLWFDHYMSEEKGTSLNDAKAIKDRMYYLGFQLEPNQDEISLYENRLFYEATLDEFKKDGIAEALNKYQILERVSKSQQTYAEERKRALFNQLISKTPSFNPDDKKEEKYLTPGKEVEELKELQQQGKHIDVIKLGGYSSNSDEEVMKMVHYSCQHLVEEAKIADAKENAYDDEPTRARILKNYEVLAKTYGVPEEIAKMAQQKVTALELYNKAVEFEKKEQYTLAILLANESIRYDQENESAKKAVNQMASRLLRDAKELSREKEEQAYEVLSLLPEVQADNRQKAIDRKLAFSYETKANQYVKDNHLTDAFIYASESNRIYQVGDEALSAISSQWLKEIDKQSLSDQWLVYTTLATASKEGPINKKKQAIDAYKKGKQTENLEFAVYYLSQAATDASLKKLAEPLLKEKIQALYDEATHIKDTDAKTAARYFKLLANTRETSPEMKKTAEEFLDEHRFK